MITNAATHIIFHFSQYIIGNLVHWTFKPSFVCNNDPSCWICVSFTYLPSLPPMPVPWMRADDERMADLQKKMRSFAMTQQPCAGQRDSSRASHAGGTSPSDDFVARLWLATYGACAQRLQLLWHGTKREFPPHAHAGVWCCSISEWTLFSKFPHQNAWNRNRIVVGSFFPTYGRWFRKLHTR